MADALPEFKVSDLRVESIASGTKLINNVCVSSCDIQIDPSRGLWFRLFTVRDMTTSLPLIVYFHGGGFRRFGPDTEIFDDFCSRLASQVPAIIACVKYRWAPEHKWPTQYEDCYEALKFIDAHNQGTVVPPYVDLTSCFIGGDSAGGNIAHHVAVKVAKNAEQFHKVRIAGVLGLMPAFGGEERTESELRLAHVDLIGNVGQTDSVWKDFLPEGADRDHPAVNVVGDSEAAKELKNILIFPPTLMIVGGKDPLQDRHFKYVEWLKNCGKKVELTVYPNAFHGFYSFPQLSESYLLFKRLADFIHKHVHPK